MTLLEIKQIARIEILKGTAILLAILIVLFLLVESSGDFANGILFFMQVMFDPNMFAMLIILFGLTYFFAGLAGEEIVIKRKNFLLISLKYVILISSAIATYAMTIAFFRKGYISYDLFAKKIAANLLRQFLDTDFALLIVWLLATNKIKKINF